MLQWVSLLLWCAIVTKYSRSDKHYFLGCVNGAIGSRLARTEKGFLALVPARHRAESVITSPYLQGGRIPLLLRRRELRWELVGLAMSVE